MNAIKKRKTNVTADRIIMTHKLKEVIPDHYQTIMNLLGPNTRLIGGLVLQTLVGDKWDTDIDIFTTDTNLTELPFGVWNKIEKKMGYIVIPGIIDIFTGDIGNGRTIDIIHVTDFNTLFTGFDLDFCKCWFDGTKLCAECPESVITKTAVIPSEAVPELRKASVRIPKYEARGFTIKREDI